jgi:hypothetical protein
MSFASFCEKRLYYHELARLLSNLAKMNIDFLDAYLRHWEDAEALFGSERWANADHLYGLAAECGLKRLMIAFGMPVTTDGDPQHRNDRVHADQVWIRYETYRSGHGSGSGYALPSPNPFNNWHVSQRYAAQTNFTQSHVNAHRTGADLVRKLIQQAQRDGLI